MTRDERNDPTIIDGSRRLRIANGSGTQTADVSQLVKQFREMQKLMKRMPGISGTKALRAARARRVARAAAGSLPPVAPRSLGRRPARTSNCRGSTDARDAGPALVPLAPRRRLSWFAVLERRMYLWPSSSA